MSYSNGNSFNGGSSLSAGGGMRGDLTEPWIMRAVAGLAGRL